MKVVILAGGKGTRFSEETVFRPKPMIEIGSYPILWHIMRWYASFGFDEFVICCGYKGHMIKEFFLHYGEYQSDSRYSLDFGLSGEIRTVSERKDKWKITLADTGKDTLTAGRIQCIRHYLDEEPFMLTYGDGVADIDLKQLLEYHNSHEGIVTISTTQPVGRFGTINMDSESGQIKGFHEKLRGEQAWVNAGFMVMEPEVFNYLGDGNKMLEDTPFERLVGDGKLYAYRHEGFWSPMDTVRDKEYLENLWQTDRAPWKVE